MLGRLRKNAKKVGVIAKTRVENSSRTQKIVKAAEGALMIAPGGEKIVSKRRNAIREREGAILSNMMDVSFDEELLGPLRERLGAEMGVVDDSPVIEAERLPEWLGEELGEGEYEVGVCAAPSDRLFAATLCHCLSESGFQVTSESSELHRTRVFVLVYSDNTVHEGTSRLLTDAASRFNMGNTVIIPVVHPRCSAYALDKIPDKLAYSLSNTTFVNFQFNLDPIDAAFDHLTGMISNYLREERAYNLSGVWRCEMVVAGECGSPAYEVRQMLMYVEQVDATTVRGLTVDGIVMHGHITDGHVLTMELAYEGAWVQDNEGWKSSSHVYAGYARVGIFNQGNRCEGSFYDLTHASGFRYGLMTCTRESGGLTGFYLFQEKGNDDFSVIGIAHRGASGLMIDLAGTFGVILDGVFDQDKVTVAADLGPYKSITFVADLVRPTHSWERHALVGSRYGLEYGTATGLCEFRAKYLTESLTFDGEADAANGADGGVGDSSGGEEAAATDGDGEGEGRSARATTMSREELKRFFESEELHEQSKSNRFVPDVFSPLSADEVACLVCYANADAAHAEQLVADLEDHHIQPSSCDVAGVDLTQARTVIALLSEHTSTDEAQQDLIIACGTADIPLFIVGLAGWGKIFFSGGWEKERRNEVLASIARLNMTDVRTLDPTHASFFGLIHRIKGHVAPREHYLSGAWLLSPTDEEQGADLSYFLFLYHDVGSTELSGVDLRGHRWTGVVRDGRVNLSTPGIEMEMQLDHTGRMLKGRMVAASHGKAKGDNNWQASSSSISQTLKGQAQNLMLKVSRQKDYAYEGTKEDDGLSGLFFEDRKCDARTGRELIAARFYGIFQRGGRRLMIKYDDRVYSGTIRDSKIRFVIKENNANKFRTVTATVITAPNGIFLRGSSYTTIPLRRRERFVSKKHLSEHDVAIAKATDDRCPDHEVEEVVRAFWHAWDTTNYAAWVALWAEDHEHVFTEEMFLDLHREKSLETGEFVSLAYFGHILIENDATETARYEFDCVFQKKTLRYAFFFDAHHRLVHTLDREVEALITNSSVYDAMISYRSTDAQWVDHLQAYLENNGILCWRDRRMGAGANWSEDITHAVRTSGCVIACLSNTYLTSSLCTKEVRLADEVGKTVLPLVLPRTDATRDHPLVRDPYTSRAPPPTLARELANVSMIHVEPVGAQDGQAPPPDPASYDEFVELYRPSLQALLKQAHHCKSNGITWNVSGQWDLSMEIRGSEGDTDPAAEDQVINPRLAIEQHDHRIQGAANLFGGLLQLVVDEESSFVLGSRIEFTLIAVNSNEVKWQLTIRAKISVNGDEFSGLFYRTDGMRGYVHAVRTPH